MNRQNKWNGGIVIKVKVSQPRHCGFEFCHNQATVLQMTSTVWFQEAVPENSSNIHTLSSQSSIK